MDRKNIFIYSKVVAVIFVLILIKIFGIPNVFESSLEERVLEDDWKNTSFTGTVLFEEDEKGKFRFENTFGHELHAFSKNKDLENFIGKEVFIEGKENFTGTGFKNLEIEKILIIEEKIFEEPKKFFLENKFGGYGFEVDENIFIAVKGGSKTFLKNGSGEIILKFFSHDFAGKGSFFSDGANETEIAGFKGEIKNLKNGQEIFLKNPKKSYGVLIQISYGKNGEYISSKEGKDVEKYNKAESEVEVLKLQVKNFLDNFYFVEKEKIAKEKCGGKENLLCPEGYFCELFSTAENANGRCVEL